MRKVVLWLLVLGVTGYLGSVIAEQPGPVIAAVGIAELPRAASATLNLIERGGPFPHRRDGVVFGNREKRLPIKPRGTYREYTVPTPGQRGRGARRIITGETGEYYYTDDHYRTFRRISE